MIVAAASGIGLFAFPFISNSLGQDVTLPTLALTWLEFPDLHRLIKLCLRFLVAVVITKAIGISNK